MAQNESYDSLISKINDPDHDTAVDAISALGELGDERAGDVLLALLQSTSNGGIRNAAALALRDLGDQRALVPLIRLIEDPKLVNNRGSLVRALRAFDCGPYFDKLVDWVIEGNFEVSQEAYQTLADMESDLTLATIEAARETVRNALKKPNPEEKTALLNQLLELMSETREDIK